MDRFKDDIVTMEGFGEKSYQKMIDSIETSRKTTLPRLIYALGIANIGVANAKLLCKHFKYDLEALKQATVENLSAIEGVGEVIATAFVDYMQDEENLRRLEAIMKEVTLEEIVINQSTQTLEGKIFVITGSLNHYGNRNDLKEEIEAKGGKVTGSVTAKTTCLINNDVTSTSSKNKKAKELQVPILSEDEFLATYMQ